MGAEMNEKSYAFELRFKLCRRTSTANHGTWSEAPKTFCITVYEFTFEDSAIVHLDKKGNI